MLYLGVFHLDMMVVFGGNGISRLPGGIKFPLYNLQRCWIFGSEAVTSLTVTASVNDSGGVCTPQVWTA